MITTPQDINGQIRPAIQPSVYDRIILVGGRETPFLGKLGKIKANSIIHSWLIDTLPEPNLEGVEELYKIETKPTQTEQKNSNHMKITVDSIKVSETRMAVTEYGGDAWTREKGKIAIAHANNLELSFFGIGETKEDFFREYRQRTNTDKGVTSGFFYYISKGIKEWDNGRRGNVVAFDEGKSWGDEKKPLEWDDIMDLMQIPWENGVRVKDMFVSAKIRGRIEQLRSRNGYTTIIQNDTLNSRVEKIITDFGEVNIHTHKFMNKKYKLDDVIIVGDFEFAKNAVLKETVFKEFQTGELSRNAYFMTENCLCVLNADAFAIGVGLGSEDRK